MSQHAVLLHLPRIVRDGREQFLLPFNRRWGVFAPPATKIRPEETLAQTSDRLRGECFGGWPRLALRSRALPAADLAMRSLGTGLDTVYRLNVFIDTYHAGSHRRIAAKTGGVWMNRAEIEQRHDVSPTAKALLADNRPLPPLGPEAEGETMAARMLRAQRDPKEFIELWEIVRTQLKAMLISKLRNYDDVEEVLQEMWIKIQPRMMDYEYPACPLGWFRRIAVNMVKDRWRGRRYQSTMSPADLEAVCRQRATPPGTRIEHSELLTLFQSRLKPVCWEVFRLRFVEGLDNREIAQKLGRSEAAVATRLTRIREKLEGIG